MTARTEEVRSTRSSTSRTSSSALPTRCRSARRCRAERPVARSPSSSGARIGWLTACRRSECDRDDHVGIFAYNSIEFLEAMLACYKIRAVPLNINFRYVGDELAYLLENGDVTTLVFDRVLWRRRSRLLTRRPPKLRSLVVRRRRHESG